LAIGNLSGPLGVNLSGFEYSGPVPGVEGRDYFRPTDQNCRDIATQRFQLVRLPVLWERLQPSTFSPFDAVYKNQIDTAVSAIAAAGLQAIIDVHNFGRYATPSDRGVGRRPIGSAHLPIDAHTDLVRRMSLAWKDEPGVWGYDVMNEWHDMPVPLTPATVERATSTRANQAALDAIRANGDSKWFLWEYDSYSNMHRFATLFGRSPGAFWTDPLKRTAISPHHYFDRDHSGRYRTAFSQADLSRVGGEITPLLDWCATAGVPCLIGECGVRSPDWLPCLERMLDTLSAYRQPAIGLLQWAEGDHYHSATKLCVNDPGGQMGLLARCRGTRLL
jgi:hypothetical protein